MTLLTAEKARELTQLNDPNKVLEAVLELVKATAQDGKYSVKIRHLGFGGSEYYCSPARMPPTGKHVIAELRKLGFEADINSNCGQFVDVWLEVSWAAAGEPRAEGGAA